MNSKKLFLAILAIMLFVSVFSQHTNVIVSNSFNNYEPNEPSIAINPLNTDEMIIGSNVDNSFISIDGGLSWQHELVQSSYSVNCDPVVIADTSGRFYYFHLVSDLSRLVCQKKDQISEPWNNGSFTAMNGTMDIDKEFAVYDPSNDRLYVSWTEFDEHGSLNINDSTNIFISWSDDHGDTWSDSRKINEFGGNASGGLYSVHGSSPACGPNGEVFVAWWDRNGLMFDRSLDGGITWMENDINTTEEQRQWIYGIPGVELGVSFPYISCDLSNGPGRGNIYICWADQSNGYYDTDIWFIRSTDNGDTWSDPLRVNSDGAGNHQFFNAMSVDPVTGKIWIVFYDRRNHSDNNTDVYMAMSDDEGLSFTDFKVSEASFLPYESVFFGHYIAIASYDNVVRAVWTRMNNGSLGLTCAIVDSNMVGVDNMPDIPASVGQNSPNPFHESTFIPYKIFKPTTVTLKIIDVFGRNVATLVDNQKRDKGKYVETFDPAAMNIAPGIYYVALVIDQKIMTRKLVYVN